jgi:VWFA-related protein
LRSCGIVAALSAQAPQTPRFRVAVDAVRIDAVVTDKDDNVVRDLTADDFEVLQDGKPQQVTSATFVAVAAAPAGRAVATVPRSDERSERTGGLPSAPPPPAAAPVRRENIQRTIALVVDDLGMSFESLYYVKRGLHKFIDESIQPGDLVALMRTGGSLDGLQPFTTDRRVLHAAVDNLKLNAFSRSGVEAFAPVNLFPNLEPVVPTGPGGETEGGAGAGVGDFSALDDAHNNVMAAGTLGALNLMIQGAKNLPGRKAVLFVSEGFQILEQGRFDNVPQPGRVR